MTLDARRAGPLAEESGVPSVDLPVSTAPGEAGRPRPAALVPFNTRVPSDLKERYRCLAFTSRRSIQDLVIAALTEYADRREPRPGTGDRTVNRSSRG